MKCDSLTTSTRLQTALDLFDAGVEMMRCRLQRENPEASDEEIERFLTAWLLERPGAEHGDAQGRPGTWPRTPAER